MNNAELHAIRERCNAATPGPWEAPHRLPYWREDDGLIVYLGGSSEDDEDVDGEEDVDGDEYDEDAEDAEDDVNDPPHGYFEKVVSVPLEDAVYKECDELGRSAIESDILEMDLDRVINPADYDFIACARADIPRLLDYIDELHKKIAYLEARQ